MIKKIIVIFIIIGLILSVSGCEKEKAVVEVKPDIKPKTVTVETVSSEETLSKTETPLDNEPQEQATEEIEVPETAKKMESTVSEELQTKEPEEKTKPVPQEKPMESNPKETVSSESPDLILVPITPQKFNATAVDSKEIANKILEYLNGYRAVPAQRLEGLTQYAEYRSRQLISNFAHSTKDERAAATALEYGEYVDPSLYGMDGEAYYTSCSREAIAKAGYTGTADEIAQRFVNLIKNSAKHWAYVGADNYSYIGVGVTYESGMWYCDVAVALENTDNK